MRLKRFLPHAAALAVPLAFGLVVLSPDAASAAVNTNITAAIADADAITNHLESVPSVLITVVGGMLGVSLLSWGGAMGFKALRRGFR